MFFLEKEYYKTITPDDFKQEKIQNVFIKF